MAKTKELTPAMRQYMRVKEGLSDDTILLFRMGDFYEIFFEDAKRAAPLMDIVLTARGGTPMCGVPYHSVRTYIARILEKGFKVAIAEQLEDPRTAKGIVKRDITQVITPGTVMDDTLLSSGKSNFLVALAPNKERCGIAMLDLSTGDFRLTETENLSELEMELNRLKPPECLAPSILLEHWKKDGFPEGLSDRLITWTAVEDWNFDLQLCKDQLKRHFGVASLDGFGCRGMNLGIAASGAILSYARNNLRQDASHITTLKTYQTNDCLVLDRISQRNLELVDPIFAGNKNNTLISVLDETITPMGTRLLRDWVLRPLKNIDAINLRLDAVQNLVEQPMLLAELQEIMGTVRDIERTVTRLCVGTSASARDLLVLRRGLEEVPGLRSVLASATAKLLLEQKDQLIEMPELTELLARAIVDEPPVSTKDGGLIRDGYNENLDQFRKASIEGKTWIAQYQLKEQERVGIKSLKVRYNKIFGYFIEISKSYLESVPPEYMRKQTLVNAERFITPELKEIEDKVLGADEKSKALELQLFQELREKVSADVVQIQQIAHALAVVDCIASLAKIAGKYHYVRPEICEEEMLDIRDGRHPVLDAQMTENVFVPNDTILDTKENQLALITGPNMAGKSTYIRQAALLVIMAQMGSFIPARKAKIGLTDRIFTRVGAADDISRGQSTFMVEMVETANILNHATSRSLIILDEIGRGTSTFDGLSLAWAIAEFLHDTLSSKARTLFATHYHELTDLALTKKGVKNYNVVVKEEGENIIFVRKILPGAADKSYGIHVARLAGIPKKVIQRATEVLQNLESNELDDIQQPKIAKSKRCRRKDKPGQLKLFDFGLDDSKNPAKE